MSRRTIKIIWLYMISGLAVSLMMRCSAYSPADSTKAPSSQLEHLTNTPTVTPIPTFRPTPTPTLSATLTPLPTLTTEQAQIKVRELFETNGGCRLPCWWGITPGKSENNAFYNFIQSIARPNMYWRFSKGLSDNIEFYVGLPKNMQYLEDSILHGRVYADDGRIIQVYLEGFDWHSYHLSSFLLENGKPDEVWIATYGLSDRSSPVPFIVYLLYSEKGMMVSYGGDGKQQADKIIGCVSVSPYLLIWAPQKKLSFVEAYELTGGDFSQNEFKPISDATESKMDAEQFYKQYKGVEGVPCIETSAALWPIAR